MGYRFEARPYPPARSSSNQTPMCLDGRLQVFPDRAIMLAGIELAIGFVRGDSRSGVVDIGISSL
jgi:hypothetical protein